MAVRLNQDTADRTMVVVVPRSLSVAREALFAAAVEVAVFDSVADTGPY